jgi:hypothetical protein
MHSAPLSAIMPPLKNKPSGVVLCTPVSVCARQVRPHRQARCLGRNLDGRRPKESEPPHPLTPPPSHPGQGLSWSNLTSLPVLRVSRGVCWAPPTPFCPLGQGTHTPAPLTSRLGPFLVEPDLAARAPRVTRSPSHILARLSGNHRADCNHQRAPVVSKAMKEGRGVLCPFPSAPTVANRTVAQPISI